MNCRRAVSLALAASLAIPSGLSSIAFADAPSPAAVAEAGRHFQRGVTMYNEADYRAALVEFRRAYEIAPNPAVLYNIGQTYYQLQNYAAALVALGRYLTESGSGAAHRREVEQTIDILQTRVGKVSITTSQPDCEVTVDDELVGKTPLGDPVLVSIGRRKITSVRNGHVTDTRYVDVAAGDTVNVTLSGTTTTSGKAAVAEATEAEPGNTLLTVGWISTAVLGAGAIVFGGLAYTASRNLSDARNEAPTGPEKAAERTQLLKDKSNKVSTYALIADVLGVATVVTGGLTLRMQLSHSSTHEAHLALSPTSIQIAGKF